MALYSNDYRFIPKQLKQHNKSKIRMVNWQTTSNAFAFIITSIAIFILHTSLLNETSPSHQVRQLSDRILQNQSISEDDITWIKHYVQDSKRLNYQEMKGFQCLLAIYYQLHGEVKHNKHIQNKNNQLENQKQSSILTDEQEIEEKIIYDFALFDNNKYQYNDLNTCEDFIMAIIFRYQLKIRQIRKHQKQTGIQTILAKQYEFTLIELAKIQNEIFAKTHINPLLNNEYETQNLCVIMHIENNEEAVKQQIQQIFNQNYQRYKVYITDDASTDNTYILLKYYLEEMKKVNLSKANKIILERNFKKSTKTQTYFHILQDHCKESDSIAILLQPESNLLGNNAFKTIANNFKFFNDRAHQKLEMITFDKIYSKRASRVSSSLLKTGKTTQKHATFTNESVIQLIKSPFFAFKLSLFQRIEENKFYSQSADNYFSNYTHELFAYNLLQNLFTSNSFESYIHIDNILVIEPELVKGKQNVESSIFDRININAEMAKIIEDRKSDFKNNDE